MIVNLRRPIRAAIGGATAALAILAGTVYAAPQATRANLAPANAAYVVSVPSTTELWSAWSGNAIYQSFRRLMDQPEFKSQTEGFVREIRTIEEALGFKLEGETLSQVFGDATVYIAPGETAGEASIGYAMGVSNEERLQRLIDLAEKAAVSAVQDDDGATTGAAADDATSPSVITTAEHQGISFKRFSTDDDTEFFYAISGKVFLGASNRGEMTTLIDRMKAAEAGPATLATDADYRKVMTGIAGQPGELYIYNNAKAAAELQQTQAGMERIRELFRRFAPVDHTATSIKIEPAKIISYSFGPLVEGAASELVRKSPGTEPLNIAGYASSGALLVFATSLVDSAFYYDMIQQAVGATGTDESAFQRQVEGLESTLGFSVKDDLVPALGNEFALLINAFRFSGTVPAVEGIVAFRVADRAKLDRVTKGIDKLAAQMGGVATDGETTGGLQSIKVGEATVKTMEIPGQAAYSPGYAIDGNYFLLGTSVEALRNSIQARQNSDRGLTASEDYKKLAPRVSTTANSFQYFNFSGIWDTVRLLTAFAGENAEQAAGIVDALRVIQVLGANSQVKDNAVVSNGVLLLKAPGAAATSAAADKTTPSESAQ